ncbi:MAG: histidine kinase N-terminal 7TM domain-containing protein, partial [Patescibacteria group bacterium]
MPREIGEVAISRGFFFTLCKLYNQRVDFSSFNFNFYSLSALVNFFVSFAFGTFVYTQNSKNPTNRSFAYFAWALAAWSLPYVFFLSATTAQSALFIIGIVLAPAIFISITFFHFIVNLLGEMKRYKRFVQIGYFVFVLFALLDLSYSPLFVESVRPISVFPYWSKGGILFHPFIILWVGYMAAGYILSIIWYKKVDAIKKAQIRYILIGVALGNFGGSLGWVLFYDIPIIPPIILVSFMIFMIGYAALKYHLFNVKVITIELLTITLWSFFLIKLLLGNQTGEIFLSDLALFLLAIIVGVFMIRSGIKEANQGELLSKLNEELGDLSRNLQRKVDDQTKEIRTAYEVEKEARIKLEELDKEKNDFILAAQHNLRTPLTVARGYAQEINSRLGEGRTEEIPSFM